MRALTGLLGAGLITLACATGAHAQSQTGQVGFLSQRDATGNSLNLCDVQVFAIPLTIHNPCHVMEAVDQYNVPHPLGPSNPMPVTFGTGASVGVNNFPTAQTSGAALEAGGHLAAVDSSTAAGAASAAADAANNAAFQGAVSLTVGAAVTGASIGRSVAAICTAAGNAEFQFPDSSNLTVPVQVGFQTFPFAANEVLSSGTTATCAFSNLK